jgi:hypothetical protein
VKTEPILSCCSRVNSVLCAFLLFNAFQAADARFVTAWTYDEMFAKSDLVIIARFKSSKDTGERSTLNDISPPSSVIGVVSEFETLFTFKGSKSVRSFRLHHYRLDEPESSNGPALITVPANRHPTFLLFLVKEQGGNYAPVTGQTDPALLSVLELAGSPVPQ